MKITKETLRELVREVIAETDAHPQILKDIKNSDII